jgi:hypothetical protein
MALGQRVFGVLLVLDVNFGKPLAGFHKRAEHADVFCAVILKPAFLAASGSMYSSAAAPEPAEYIDPKPPTQGVSG